MNEILDKLNEEQLKPVLDTEGPVLVIAGAGSGKTRVLTSRIAYLIKEKHVSPYNILAITFTNKAADEMRERIARIVGPSAGDIWVSTIHGMCTRILRRHISVLGYDRNFTIYTDSERDRVVKRVVTSLGYNDEKITKNSKQHISNAKTQGIKPELYSALHSNEPDIDKVVEVYKMYERELKASNALDFDDLLLKTRDLLLASEDVRDTYSSRFEYIHIDEFQDTNAIQYEIVNLLSQNHENIFVVGDDDQSIYGWRGAELKNILNFEKDHAGTKVYKLERNYRSTKRILSLANLIIKNNVDRKEKELWTENDDGVKVETYTAPDETNEAMYTAIQIKSLMARGMKAHEFAVLMRINALTRAYEQEFLKYGIPYKVFGGFKFYERKEVKDLLAYFRLLVNPLDNDALLRIINVPRRGIGGKTIEVLSDYAASKGVCLYDSILEVENIDIGASAKKKIVEFRNTILSLIIDKETLPMTDLLSKVLEKTDFMEMFDENNEENFNKKANIGELQNSIEEYSRLNKDASIADFLNSVTLSSDADEMDEGDYVTLATIHSVKGLEFGVVFICGLEENVFPISRASSNRVELEEERRLMYVAITRAEKRLFLTCSQSRFLFGERQRTIKSRFLTELGYGTGAPPVPAPSWQREEGRYRGNYNERVSAQSSGAGFVTGAKSFLENRKKPEVMNENTDEFVVGRRVHHAKFGDGIIVSATMGSTGKIIDVAFKGAGVKRLSLRFAPVELI